jgi:hypothetical protein
MSWRKTAKSWAARSRDQATRVAAQGCVRARLAGRRLAAKVVGLQLSARLPDHLMIRSHRTVLCREHARAAETAFAGAYADTVRELLLAERYSPVLSGPDREPGS